VLQPAHVSSLSFEIGGQLKTVGLIVGQKVQLGDSLPKSIQDRCRARLTKPAPACSRPSPKLDNAQLDFQRKEKLLKRGGLHPGRFRKVERHPA
jgi:hypothetical protein